MNNILREYKYNRVLIAIIALMVMLIFNGCGVKNAGRTDFAMDTIVDITIYDCDGNAEEIIDNCFLMIEEYDKLFSAYNTESDIYKINHAGGKTVEVSRDTARLLSLAKEYGQLTNGVFDISSGELIKVWGINGSLKEEHKLPDKSQIDEALKNCDYNQIEINDNQVRLLTDGISIDVGGIAKGYIADKLYEYMKESSVKSGLINLGGNVIAVGKKTDGSEFNIGIPEPFNTPNIIYSVKVSDKTVVTSGNYQRYFEKDGEIYHHILDLSTGYPAKSGLSSVTVITDNSTLADALSTACFIMGYDDSVKLLADVSEKISIVFVTDEKKVLTWEN